MSLEITKFKRTAKGDIHIEYTQIKADVEIGLSLTNPEAPAQSFDEALNKIVPHFVDLAEMPSEEGANLKIVEITFTRTGEDKTLGWQATAFFKLTKIEGKRFVKLPKFLCHDGAASTSTNLCSHVVSESVYDFLKECEKYIAGERLQIKAEV